MTTGPIIINWSEERAQDFREEVEENRAEVSCEILQREIEVIAERTLENLDSQIEACHTSKEIY